MRAVGVNWNVSLVYATCTAGQEESVATLETVESVLAFAYRFSVQYIYA